LFTKSLISILFRGLRYDAFTIELNIFFFFFIVSLSWQNLK